MTGIQPVLRIASSHRLPREAFMSPHRKSWSKSFSVEDFIDRYALISSNARILNAGSAETRYGANCINIDVQAQPNVDVVCDLHELPPSLGQFDAVICNAVLQYCANPRLVASNLHAALKPGGFLFVDAPWVQPYCPDTPDRHRFTQEGLRDVFSIFEIVECGPSLKSGAALHMQAVAMAQYATRNRYVNFALSHTVSALLHPVRWLRTTNEPWTAGAFYLIARRQDDAASGATPGANSGQPLAQAEYSPAP